jgi:hypothetical protein
MLKLHRLQLHQGQRAPRVVCLETWEAPMRSQNQRAAFLETLEAGARNNLQLLGQVCSPA